MRFPSSLKFHPLRAACAWKAVAILPLATAFLSAETSYTVEAPSITRNFILAGDSQSPARDGVATSVSAEIETDDSEEGDYRFRFELQRQRNDGSWTTVMLQGDAEFFDTSPTPVDIDTDPNTPQPSSQTLSASPSVNPASPLDPYTDYRIRVNLQRERFLPDFFIFVWGNVGAERFSDPGKLYQFTNTTSIDDALNVISTVETTRLSNPFFLEAADDPAKRGFELEVDTKLRRWDNYNGPNTPASVPLEFNVTLIEQSTGNPVPLEQSTFSRTRSIDAYFNQLVPFTQVPRIQSYTETLTITPNGQLDPVNKSYAVEVTVAHEENPVTGTELTGNTKRLENARLYDFNGELHFGGRVTQLENFTRDPQPTPIVQANHVALTLDGVDGHLGGRTGYTYDAPSTVDVRLLADGTATVESVGAALPVTPPTTPDTGTASGVNFHREAIELGVSGLASDLRVFLPQGMGYVPVGGSNRRLSGTLEFSSVALNGQLTPQSANLVFRPGSPVRVLEETKPAYISADTISWDTESGAFTAGHASNNAGYVRETETAYLKGAPIIPDQRLKADNSGYYTAIAGVEGADSQIATDADGGAAMDVAYTFNSGLFRTHFPFGVDIDHDGGGLSVSQDSVVSGSISLNAALTLRYDQTCAETDCNSGEQKGSLTVAPDALVFTADGGLVGAGPLQGTPDDKRLSWGYIASMSEPGSPVFAQQIGSFAEGTFHATGHFIRGLGGGSATFNPGAEADAAARNAPADTLLAAVKGSSVSAARSIARPGSPEDRNGQFAYAGLNLETPGDGSVTGVATIANQTVAYKLRGCNKFYVRQVGVTGTVEAVPGTFPGELTLYGYEFDFDYYGLGYLDSRTSPRRSFTKGSVATPEPTNSNFAFEGMSFTCLGGLDEARLPEGGLATVFDYWNADIDVATLGFTTSDGCNPKSSAYLTLGATAYSTLIDQPLNGVVGIKPDGHLITRDFSVGEGLETVITSRFRLPNRVRLDGPENEQYDLTVISEAYLNNQDLTSEQAQGEGRMHFAAKVDVPFFEDLKAHLRTTASKTTNPSAVVDLMGGWTEGGQTFFSTAFFDTANRGFPQGVDEALYRNAAGASGDPSPYLINAEQEWLEVVELSYPLEWSSSLRTFSAFEPEQGEDLLIIEVDHQLEYLSAERAELSFGAQYEGLPSINLTNFVFNKIDEETGALQAATDALRGEVVDALDTGLQRIDSVLQDKTDALLDGLMDNAVDSVVDAFYAELQTVANPPTPVGNWETEVDNAAQKFFVRNLNNTSNDLRDAIRTLADAGNTANGVIQTIDTALRDLQLALRSVHDRIYLKNGTVRLSEPSGDFDELNGLLFEENGEFQIVDTLIARLIDEVGGQVGDRLESMLNDSLSGPAGKLQDLINEQLERVRPTLERVRTVLSELDKRVGTIRDEIENGTAFVQEFTDILNAADTQIETVTADLRDDIGEFIVADIPTAQQFDAYTAEELKRRIKTEIKDRIREMELIREIQQVVRQKLYDIDLAIKEGIDSAFAQVNVAVKNLISQYLANFDASINGVIGDINSVVGSGQFDGFAHINGDALKLLRVDATIQFKVPKDMEFEGYFQIKQLASDGSGSCSYSATGTPAKEITIGTPGVPVEWLSPGMEIGVEGKVTYSDRPLGLGGKIEMVGGSFNFEAFEITDLGAAMSFGKTENYLAAKVGLKFQSYDIYGGVFFGQTCSITPVELVNEEAATVLGPPDPTFTGAYVYGEAHIPVSETILGIPATCMFRITAGVGAGAFYFVEGQTFGGQILLAVSGEALCLVGVNGEVSLIGAKVGDDLRFRGRGTIGGRVGACPVCVKFSKTIILQYINDRWKFQL